MFEGMRSDQTIPIISALKATKLIRQGCREFLASVINTQRFNIKIEDIPVVSEFPDVLPEDLPSLPLDREVKFVIDLLPKTNPIF